MNTNVVALRSGAAITPIIPTSIEEVFRLAKYIEASGLAPSSMKTAEQITVAIMHGLELGLPPMQAVQRIAVINGRPALWGDAIPALLYSRGFKLKEWGDDKESHCTVTRPDGSEITRSFSKKQAADAGLLSKGGPWKQYPERMMQMRARAFAARDGAADVLAGLYAAEEIDGGELVEVRERPQAKAVLDVPDIPDVPEPDDQSIKDPGAFVAMIEEQLSDFGNSPEAKAELSEQYADLIDRLPDDWKGKAQKLLEA
jgi:hypothetical protein